MLKTKRNLEKLENFADKTVMTEPPRQLDKENLADLRSQMEAALATAEANETPRILRQPRFNENKSRLWLDQEIYKIANRILADPSPLTINLERAGSQINDADTDAPTTSAELHVLLRELRKKLVRK